jgi:transcription initiation factor TFIIIB Brf1 subunit/transcription initiation factor TFIIB
MSSVRICKECGSSEIEVDRAQGITYCVCGIVLEESIIVSEVQIEEGQGGGMSVVGQFVSANDTRGISINGLQHSMRESREITLQNGKKLITEMASQLRLDKYHIDCAFNFYKMAVQQGITRGRKIRQVIAVCLYLVCRTQNKPYMLLDLCDVVHDDGCFISNLGRLAMVFATKLFIKLPVIDPGLFIPRFAQKMDFGDKTQAITITALRLIQRMNRDWMTTGRRPSGLCGAALLVAARMYDFERSLDDIVKVVKIGKTTLRKRMLEFEDTPSSNLTVDEFNTIDLEEEHDPPAYTRSRKFAKMKQIEEMVNIQEIEKEIMDLQENIELALSELNKPRGMYAKYSKLSEFEDKILGPNKDLTNIDDEIKEAEEFLSDEQIKVIKDIINPDEAKSVESIEPSTSNSSCSNSEIDVTSPKWNNLRPTLRSLGLARTSHLKPLNEEEENEEENKNNLSVDTEHDENDNDNDDDDDDDDDDEKAKKRKKTVSFSEGGEKSERDQNKDKKQSLKVDKSESDETKGEPRVNTIDIKNVSNEDDVEEVDEAKGKLNRKPKQKRTSNSTHYFHFKVEELDLTGIDDDEIDSVRINLIQFNL